MTMYKFPAPAKLELVTGVFEMGMVLRWWGDVYIGVFCINAIPPLEI